MTKPHSGATHAALGLPTTAMGDEAEEIAAWESALTIEPIRALIRICLAQATPQAAGG